MKRFISFSMLILGCYALIATAVYASTGQETPPRPPLNDFSVVIENGVDVTHNRKVVLLINGGPDADRMAISATADFKQAGIQKYSQVAEWTLPEEEGQYNVYVRIYTRYGVASPTFSDSIVYKMSEPIETNTHTTVDNYVLQPGDLFKQVSSSAVYYYGSDKKRYVFPTENVFFSWFSVDDFKRVKTVSSKTLSSISIGGNIVYKPGSSLVKIKSDNKVYAVGFKGALHWVHSQEVARTLYGNGWVHKIHDIPDTLFGNYHEGRRITSALEPPDGYLFTLPDDKAVYIIDDEQRRPLLNVNALNLNGFSFDNVHALESVGYGKGAAVGGQEPQFADAAQIY